MKFLKNYYGLFLILILSFWAIKPFFISGFFPMHDDTQVARVFEMGKALKDGIFPVRWVPDLGYGYGYPIFNFYAPLAYYVGGLFTVLGFDALIATKIMMVMGIILSGIFMYLLAREFWGELGGIVSALFYVYAPYHAVDIYVRGDVAEFWAYALIPLMFLGFYKVFDNSKLKTPASQRGEQNSKLQLNIQKFGIVGGLGYAGVILSHNLTALMVTPFLLIAGLLFIIFSKKEARILNTLYLILYTSLGLALSAFYWIPALSEMKYTNVLSQIGGGADFRDHFVCIGQLWDSAWGFGGSARGCIDGLSFKIGKLHLLSVFAALLLLFIAKRYFTKIEAKQYNDTYHYSGKHTAILCIVGFVISIFFVIEISKPVWEAIWPMAFFQYPWRFLILTSFFSSLLSGFTIWFLKKTAVNNYFNTLMYCSTGILIFSLLFFNLKFFAPQTIFPANSSDFTNEIALKWTASKTSDEFLPSNFKKPKSENDIGKNPIPFKETTLEKASNAVSLIGASALIIGIIFKYAKTKR